MYAKVFSQVFESSLAEDYKTRHIFIDLLILADPEGIIDMTPAAIARRTNVPLREVKTALAKLEQPDPQSRSARHQGRRIVKLDPKRAWGWQIVNFAEYNKMRDESARREYMRTYMRKRRGPVNSAVNTPLTPVNTGKPPLAHIDVAAAAAAANTAVDKETDKKAVAAAGPPGAATAKTEERAGDPSAVPAAAETTRPLRANLRMVQQALGLPVGKKTAIDAAELLGRAGLSSRVASELGLKYGYDRVREALGIALKRRARNPPGMIRQALEENWTT
jgi:hypothetical protein